MFDDGVAVSCKCPPGNKWLPWKQICAAPDPNRPDPNKEPPSCPNCGNPINPANGAKIQKEVDFVVGSSGLSFERFYNGSQYNVDESLKRFFGRRWITRFDSGIREELVKPEGGPNAYCFQSWSDDVTSCYSQSQPLTGTNVPAIVSVSRPNGERNVFTMTSGVGVSDADISSTLRAGVDANNNIVWTFVDANTEDVEKYSATGKLLSITSRSGITQTLTYATGVNNNSAIYKWPADAPVCSHVQGEPAVNEGSLLCVTDNWGNQIQFETGYKGITKVIAPDNQEYTFTYDGPSAGCTWRDRGEWPHLEHNYTCDALNLTGLVYPDGKTKTYHYNEPGLLNSACRFYSYANSFSMVNMLTGITDENGVRFASWGYDCKGNATLSMHAGGVEKVVIEYGFQGEGHSTHGVKYFTGTSTNPGFSGTAYAYDWKLGVAKYRGTYDRCAGCLATKGHGYDANGNLTSKYDWKDIGTSYDFDMARNLEIRRTDAFNTSQPLTTTTSWHATYRLPAQINEPLLRTTYTYDAKGNALTKTTQATTDTNGSQGANASVTGTPRVWTYTYNNVGQMLTVTGPRTDVVDRTTYTYDTKGNLSTVSNAAGHVTTLANYDGNGRVGQITDPNGLVTTLSYTPRGWLSQRVTNGDGVSETTSYQYDGVGQMTKVTLPDGSSISYTYDDAHRLIKINDSLGNSINYTLDIMSNRINETVTDSSGNLTRQVSRVYDTLNQLRTVTGAAQ
ncbi:DUF6531 domain-containing protein [Undibacterium sp. Di26W]|uniref:DUF6531 domain-containing protein n=1 Tax=Undibacterium sp. Di26W TaxID=3413035 RepID=UPI003BF48EFF